MSASDETFASVQELVGALPSFDLDEETTKNNLPGEDPMAFLPLTPAELPQFSVFDWRIAAAVVVDDSRSNSSKV